MHGAFCDQPWSGNDPGDDPWPILCCGAGDTAQTAHTVRLPDVLRRCDVFLRFGGEEMGILLRRQKFRKERNKMQRSVIFRETRQKQSVAKKRYQAVGFPCNRMLKLSSSRGVRIDAPVLSVSWSFEDHSVNIKALRKGLIEHEASDTGGVPRWQSSCLSLIHI